ncbi:hypothetical protein ASF26_16670 [Methylobacterium sp. Leaf93]|nr:hypothetical protein ASF26_16670 [Methylobacterium sp. Leaf93]
MALSGCVASDPLGQSGFGPSGAAASRSGFSDASLVDLTARGPKGKMAGRTASRGLLAANGEPGRSFNFGTELAESGAAERSTASVPGEGNPFRPVALRNAAEGQPSGGLYRMNFEDADIKEVLQSVLGTILGVTYTVAPNVSGRITLSSTSQMTRIEVLSTLETVLAAQNISLTKIGSTYRVAPMAVGGGVVDAGEALSGNGVSVVPLRFTSVATMTKLLSGFIAESDGLRIDPGRNAILVRGPAPNREEVVRAIESFDTDWMQNQSVSLFEVRRARVDAVVAELTRIFDNETNGSGSGLIQFKPISRLRAILAVSKNPALIRRAETWIRRLDQESDRAADNVFVYRPRHRDAKELARLVGGLFKGGGTGPSDAAGGAGPGGSLSTTPFGGGSQDRGGEGGSTNPGGMQASLTQPASTTRTGGFPTAPVSAEAFTPDAAPGESEPGRGGQSRRLSLSVNADPANNTVVSYTDGETYQKVLAVMRSLDIPPVQVAINVMIAEVQLNDALKYGIQFYLRSNRVGLGENRGSIGLVDTAEQVLKSKLPGFNFVGGGNSPDVVISALDSISKVQVLSSPSLVVMENKPAVLQVGDQVPITTRQGQSVVNVDAPILNQVEFKDTGIILKLIPRVGQSDTVTLDVEQEISNVSAGADTLTPTISRRRVSSSLTINNGQTVLLAGMISESRRTMKDGIPYLARTLIGDLFGSTDKGFDRKELVMFIRPVVVRNGEDAASVAEEFRSRLKFSDRPRADAPARTAVHKP